MKYFTLYFFCLSLSGFGQILLELPPIEGEEVTNAAAEGWEVYSDSPDIITGNGLWYSKYTTWFVSGVDGDTTNGNMAFFIALPNGYAEGWKTDVKGLKIGETYSIAFQWQQVKYYTKDKDFYAGGGLKVIVDGQVFNFDFNKYEDTWHHETVEFVAGSKEIEVVIQAYIPDGGCHAPDGCAIVVDNIGDCRPCKEAGKY